MLKEEGFLDLKLVTVSLICEEEDIHELIKKADDILYSIKKKRKGTYAFFDLDRGQQKDEVQ